MDRIQNFSLRGEIQIFKNEKNLFNMNLKYIFEHIIY